MPDELKTQILSYATPPRIDPLEVRREGILVVARRGSTLPPCCVRCNRHAPRTLTATLRYYPTFRLAMTTLFRVRIPLCVDHRAIYRRYWWMTFGLRLLGVQLVLQAFALVVYWTDEHWALWALLAAGILVLFVGERLARRLVPLRIYRATSNAPLPLGCLS